MIIKKWKEAVKKENPHKVDVRVLYDEDEAMLNVVTLQAGESLKSHITPVNVIFYVLEGKGVVEIGDEKQEVLADSLIESPKDIKHCWYNESDAVLRFIVIKAPRPRTQTRIL